MLRRFIQAVTVITSVTAFTGCANPGIVQLSPDTYMLGRTDRGGIFGNATAMKADVIREANEFAASQGKVAIPLAVHENPLIAGQRFASIEYQFRVVDKNDPEARRTSLIPRADVVIEKKETSTIDVRTKQDQSEKKDVYGELIKLDDLRKRGILSDAEFEAQKKKLLSGN